MQKTYKKILFDLDNTLVDDDENRKYAIKQIMIERNEDINNERVDEFVRFDNQFWKDRAEGRIKDPYTFENLEEKTKWIRAERFIRFFKNVSFEEAVEINSKYIKNLNEHIVPIENSQEILKYLYEKQYDIYIVTNGPTKAISYKLNKINAQDYIKRIFSAEEAGEMKPSNKFFQKFFNTIESYDTDEMIIIGDELDKDVLGGINNDIDSCWVNLKKLENNTTLKPSYELNNLLELKNIL